MRGADALTGGRFFLPVERKLPEKVLFQCRHCGEKYYEERAIEYCWHDRKRGQKQGLVIVCRSCGCRQELRQQKKRKKKDIEVKRGLLIAALTVLLMLGSVAGLQALIRWNSSGDLQGQKTEELELPVHPTDEGDNDKDHQEELETPPSPTEDELTQQSPYDALPDRFYTGHWDTDRKLQGLEWNTDTLDTYYISNSRYIGAYDLNGKLLSKCNKVDGYLLSIDYFDNKVFSVMWPAGNGKFKLRVYDASDMHELLISTKLPDIQQAFSADKKRYGDDLVPSINAVTVAPKAGGGSKWKVYISYNVYHEGEDSRALHTYQRIYEYDYESIMEDPDELYASNTIEVNFGDIDAGIQTLEYDSEKNQMWCAVQQGRGDYSLYCLDWKTLRLVRNGDQEGWNCPNAATGFCSLGEDTYYVLVPSYGDGYASADMVKAHSGDLEDAE